MKKKSLLATIAALALSTNVMAQEWQDVTDNYLKNAGFDVSSDWETENVPVDPATVKDVSNWIVSGSTSWAASASFGFGESGTINGTSIPGENSSGKKEGGCVAITGAWDSGSGFVKYEQSVTLPAGQYKISFMINNIGKNTGLRTSYFGFNGTYGTTKSFTENTWTTESITVTLDNKTNGNISFGFGWSNTSSSNTPKLCVDYVKIEKATKPQTFFNGTYYLYNEESGTFLSRGSSWGTQATNDPFGLPVNVTNVLNDGESISKIINYDWNSTGLGTNLYTDNGNPSEFTFKGNNTDGFTIFLSGDEYGYVKASEGYRGLTYSKTSDDYCLWKFVNLSQYNEIQNNRKAS